MTIETRGTIELADITAVEFECKKCRTKTVRKLDKNFSLPGICGNCNETWMVDGEFSTNLRFFLNLFARYAAANEPYVMRFEVAGIGETR